MTREQHIPTCAAVEDIRDHCRSVRQLPQMSALTTPDRLRTKCRLLLLF